MQPPCFQPGDIEQPRQQTFGRGQCTIEMAHRRDLAAVLGQGVRKQLRGMQRLHQIMADGGKKTALCFVCTLRLGACRRQLACTLAHAPFECFVRTQQGIFSLSERGDIGKRRHEAATGHRVATNLHHRTIGETTLGQMSCARAHMRQPPLHALLEFALADHAAIDVVARQLGHRTPDLQQFGRIIEQAGITTVPGYQA